jgi:hypothetical protein
MNPTVFDDLTKALAAAPSRRQALRWIGGILTGVSLAGIAPGVALADNSACAHFCNSVFDPGPDRGQCTSDAAHGTGLCYTCGPASPGGNQPICCPENPDGTCTSYSSATCCTSGKVCQKNQCVDMCRDGIKDGQETDVDCGGPVCNPCQNGKNCLINRDCVSGKCQSGKCLP